MYPAVCLAIRIGRINALVNWMEIFLTASAVRQIDDINYLVTFSEAGHGLKAQFLPMFSIIRDIL